MPLSQEALEKLINLSGYDKMLEMDSISRVHGISLSEIEAEINIYKSNKQQLNASNDVGFEPVEQKDFVNLDEAKSITSSPQYISNPEQYRMKYNPSQQGLQNQSRVSQAIICPSCSSPLGIPEIRPIKITCPECMQETTFVS
ncbi:MAG: hypothetical protein QGI21_05350 [Candidatus Poseidoniaceae archaeon]|jgi:hypothetical protein|nr:hypothetical protein [Candidatus Poseidoniaceae archaeon]